MWVFGNGESRSTIDINSLDDLKIGCNAIYRDYCMNYLVCVDRRMVDEAVSAGANKDMLIYTREDWYPRYKEHKRIRCLPNLPYAGNERWDEPFQWGSGPYAVLLGAKLCKERNVKLLGFDLYSNTNTVNNVYKGTTNYDSPNKRAVDPRYWIHQIGMVFKSFPKVRFTVYQEDEWELPKAWKNSNVSLDSISNL